jgi:hypothetical protein
MVAEQQFPVGHITQKGSKPGLYRVMFHKLGGLNAFMLFDSFNLQ